MPVRCHQSPRSRVTPTGATLVAQYGQVHSFDAASGARSSPAAYVAVAVQQVGRDPEVHQGKGKVKSSVATLNGFMKMKRANAIWKRLVRSILKGKGGEMDGPSDVEVPLNLRILRLRYSSGPPADVLPVPFLEAPHPSLVPRPWFPRHFIREYFFNLGCVAGKRDFYMVHAWQQQQQ